MDINPESFEIMKYLNEKGTRSGHKVSLLQIQDILDACRDLGIIKE